VFLSRPIQLTQFVWGSSFTDFKLDPWGSFLNNSIVQQKLQGFSRLRGDLVVEFVVNGTQFHYGRLLISYEPNVVSAGLSGVSHVVRHSQLPHVTLDPCLATKLKMRLPYTSNFYWMDLLQATSTHVGVLWFNEIGPIMKSNTTTDYDVTVTVFAWMENVKLTVPSQETIPTFTLQSGEGEDEYGDTGAISSIASSVAKVAGKLVSIPFIGPFARATEIGSSAIGSIAKIFGYSYPLQLEPVHFMKQVPVTNLSYASGDDLSTKFSVDPKCEMTIDSRIIDLDGTDELSIDYLKTIPSYITSFTWDTTTVPGTLLAKIPVSPMFCNKDTVTGGFSYDFSPAGGIGYMFGSWTGSMKIHLQFVASKFHRGRIRVSYCPNGEASSLDPTIINENFSSIVDLSESHDYGCTIGWASPAGWARCGPVVGSDVDTNSVYCNGYLAITVLNELVAPLDGQGITVNIWTSGGEDLQFANPTLIGPQTSILTLQGREVEENDSSAECCKEIIYHPLVANMPRTAMSLAHMGEDIVSLRTLLKRPCQWGVLPITDQNNLAYEYNTLWCAIPRLPLLPGRASSIDLVMHRSSDGTTTNYTSLTPLSFVTRWFLGHRGSTRAKILLSDSVYNQSTGNYRPFIETSRIDVNNLSGFLPYGQNYKVFSSTTTNSEYAYATVADHWDGLLTAPSSYTTTGAVVNNIANQCVEIELPDYNNLLYHPLGNLTSSTYEVMTLGLFRLTHPFTDGVNTWNYNHSYRICHSIGEDFQLLFFKGVPQVFSQPPAGPSTATASDSSQFSGVVAIGVGVI
jgi:hypothetical protein